MWYYNFVSTLQNIVYTYRIGLPCSRVKTYHVKLFYQKYSQVMIQLVFLYQIHEFLSWAVSGWNCRNRLDSSAGSNYMTQVLTYIASIWGVQLPTLHYLWPRKLIWVLCTLYCDASCISSFKLLWQYVHVALASGVVSCSTCRSASCISSQLKYM